MKVSVTDEAALRSLSPYKLSLYLRRTGWKLRSVGAKGDVWHSEYGQVSVRVPDSTDYIDYPEVVHNIVQLLARLEQRSELAVFEDIDLSRADLVTLSVPSSDGRISLALGRALVHGGITTLSAAAASAVKSSAYHRSKRPPQAASAIRATKLAQTERGSFVVRIAVEHPSPEPGILIDVRPEPFTRKMTDTFGSAVLAVRQAIDATRRHGDYGIFKAAITQGVSGNLCEALCEIIECEQEANSQLEIAVKWTTLFDEPPRRRLRAILVPEDKIVLREAAEMLKTEAPVDDFELVGAVVRLERGEEAASGVIAVAATIDGSTRLVRVELDRQNYDLATVCHRKDQLVSIVGVLRHESKTWKLDQPSNLVVLTRDRGSEGSVL